MKLIVALAASILFGTGAFMLLNRDPVRVVWGSCSSRSPRCSRCWRPA